MQTTTQLPAIAQEWHDDLMVAASRFFEEDPDGFPAFVAWFESYVNGRYQNDSDFKYWNENGYPFCGGPAGWWLRSSK